MQAIRNDHDAHRIGIIGARQMGSGIGGAGERRFRGTCGGSSRPSIGTGCVARAAIAGLVAKSVSVVGEMREIATFGRSQLAVPETYEGLAQLYASLAKETRSTN